MYAPVPLGFIRTPKPCRAPSPLSHRNTSLPSGLGRRASTTRLLSFVNFLGSLVGEPRHRGRPKCLAPTCFPGPRISAGEARGKRQEGNSRNVEERPEPNHAPKRIVLSTFRND